MSTEPTETQKAKSGPEATAAISMEFTNYSTEEFQRGDWNCYLQYGFGSLDTSPGPTLQANSGVQSMSASQILSSIDTGPYWIYVTWAAQSNWRFGMKLYVPFQMFGIGKAPYWYVSYDTLGTSDQEPDWILSGDDPSYPYQWPSEVGYDIVATPTAGHTSLDVQVLIQNSST